MIETTIHRVSKVNLNLVRGSNHEWTEVTIYVGDNKVIELTLFSDGRKNSDIKVTFGDDDE